MSDGPVLKPTIKYVSNDLLIREQLISAQKEEPLLPCSKSFSVEEAENVNVHERLSIADKMANSRCDCVR